MDDLHTILNGLEDNRLDYVIARSRTKADAPAFRDCGMSKSTFYKWDEEERDYLNGLAQRLKRETAVKAIMMLQDAVEQAAEVKIAGLKSSNKHIQQSAASEILDRQLGKPTQKQEISGPDGGDMVIKVRSFTDDEE